MESSTLETILSLLNTGGVIAALLLIVIMFFRGDILSRRVWAELTEKILEEFCQRMEKMFDDLRKQNGIRRPQHPTWSRTRPKERW